MSRMQTVHEADPRPTESTPRPLTAFVGRHRDIDSVQAALSRSRMVCLTGPGGCGKTRIAIEIARAQSVTDAVVWVDLAPRTDPATLPRALATALGVREAVGRDLLESVVAHLAASAVLLVLDNCEHLLPECAETARRLLIASPTTRVLATSRERLGLPGELVWHVAPLTYPGAHGPLAPRDLLGYESVQLFCERAETVLPGFILDDSNAASVARICRDLDGLALAIELAAARVRLLSVAEVADALQDRLAVLTAAGYVTSDRQRSLRATLDWSHRLLTEPERRLFAELSVFTGGFTLAAAAAVHVCCPGEPDVLELMSHLVDRSLVSAAVEGGHARYCLPETLRMYAAEHLERSGHLAATQLRLTRWCVDFAERAEPELTGPDQSRWLDQVEVERANIGAALRWSLSDSASSENGLRIFAALWRFCYLRGYYSEGRSWSAAALAATASAAASPSTRARALVGAGNLAYLQCSYAEATSLLEDALAAYREMADDRGVAAVLHSLGSIARERSRYEAAHALHLESRELSRHVGDTTGIARADNYLGLLAWLQEDLPEAAALAEQALGSYRIIGDGEGIAWSLINLAASALYSGHGEQGRQLLDESLARSRAIGFREGTAWSLNLLGVLALEGNDPHGARTMLRESLREHWSLGDIWRTASVLEALAATDAVAAETQRAGRLLGAARSLRDRVGAPAPPIEGRLILSTEGRIEQRVGANGRIAAERIGRLAAIESVVGELLVEQVSDDTDTPSRPKAVTRVIDRVPRVGVATLGGCRIQLGDVAVTAADFGYAKPRELLCFLIDRVEATKEQIGVALWPWASPARLRSSFHTTLHHLRSALGPDRVVFADGRYRFDRSMPYSYDVENFETRVARSTREDGDDMDLSAAIALYRGDYLVDLVGEGWIDDRRTQLSRSFGRALSALARSRMAAGSYDDAIEILHRAVTHDPLSETAHQELMSCYSVTGQRASALRQYRALSELLRGDLDTSPTPATAALHERIRCGVFDRAS